jgi:hypothetical protein
MKTRSKLNAVWLLPGLLVSASAVALEATSITDHTSGRTVVDSGPGRGSDGPRAPRGPRPNAAPLQPPPPPGAG